ncbi:uncharacterized protein LOC144667319 [Oculina patagonica]
MLYALQKILILSFPMIDSYMNMYTPVVRGMLHHFFPKKAMLLATLVFILSLAEKMRAKENGVFFKIDENAFLFNENSIFNGKADSLLSCSQMCAKQDACKSANFIASHGTCSLHTDGQTEQAENILKRDGSLYLEKVGSPRISNSPGKCSDYESFLNDP